MKRFVTATVALGSLAAAAVAPAPALADTCVKLSVALDKNGTQQVCSNGTNGGVIVTYLTWIIQFLAGLVGAVIVLMLVIAGIQYLTSTGDPARVKEAKNRIINALTALLLFIFMFAILNALIPGGILK